MSSQKDRVQETAVVGAGLAGLAAAWKLAKAGHQVVVFEKENEPGGLASGFNHDGWNWTLEHHYHHIFASDHSLLNWLNELELKQEMKFYDVISASLINGQQHRLDSAVALLKIPYLSLFDKLRMGAVLAFFKILPNGAWLEKWRAESALRFLMGARGYDLLWQPIFEGKFGEQTDQVNLAWFWARIKARTKYLGYPDGGFLRLIKQIVLQLEEAGVEFYFKTDVASIKKQGEGWLINISNKGGLTDGDSRDWPTDASSNKKDSLQKFDQVLVTGSAKILSGLCPDLPKAYSKKISNLKMLGAVTLVLELEKPFFKDKTYWLNITQHDWPMLAVVEHTNLVGSKNFGGKSLLYVGNYLSPKHKHFSLSAKELIKLYKPYLDQLSPGFSKRLVASWVFRHSEAQPVVGVNHSQNLPQFSTPLDGLFWSSMQHIYPWDRGTNFAVQAGLDVAEQMERFSR